MMTGRDTLQKALMSTMDSTETIFSTIRICLNHTGYGETTSRWVLQHCKQQMVYEDGTELLKAISCRRSVAEIK